MAFFDSGATYDSGLVYDAAMPTNPPKRMAKIKLNLDRLSIADLLLKAADIKTKMTGNANFTTPVPPLATLNTQITSLTTSNNTYNQGELTQKQNKTTRDNDEAALRATLALLAGYVEAASGGDAAKIQSAGMDVRATSAPVGEMAAPQNLSVTGGDLEGENDLHWEPVNGRTSYIAESASVATGPWTQFYVGKKSSVTAKGATSGSLVYFRVRAVGAAGPGPWSDIAHSRAT
jgi:hypothetical protein